jgi:type IV secretory pathway protease TraF
MSALALGCGCLLIGVFAVSAAPKQRSGAARRGFAGSLVDLRLVRPRWSFLAAVGVAGAELALLGDNRAASGDSRVRGALPAREIVGVAVRRLVRHD